MNRLFVKTYGSEVSSGPFEGMLYESHPTGDVLMPKLLGVYEQELHEHIETLIGLRPTVIVNVGCGTGYYAVGFALRLPDVRVIASDTSPSARHECARIAEVNGVASRVRTVGRMTVEQLQRSCGPTTLVLIDCEGCEFELLCPDQVPALSGTTVIAECHDFLRPGLTDEVVGRFEATHLVSVIEKADREIDDYRQLSIFSLEDREVALSEYRQEDTRWVVMVPLASQTKA